MRPLSTQGGPTIIHLSIHTPKPGKEQDLIDSEHCFGAAGAGQPGFVEAKTLRDRRTGRLVGMARREDEALWEAAETESFLLKEA